MKTKWTCPKCKREWEFCNEHVSCPVCVKKEPSSIDMEMCQVLRELGFKPWGFGWWCGRVIEFVSYPFSDGWIKARTEVGDPTTMIDIKCSQVDTMETFQDKMSEWKMFLDALSNRMQHRLPEHAEIRKSIRAHEKVLHDSGKLGS